MASSSEPDLSVSELDFRREHSDRRPLRSSDRVCDDVLRLRARCSLLGTDDAQASPQPNKFQVLGAQSLLDPVIPASISSSPSLKQRSGSQSAIISTAAEASGAGVFGGRA